MMKIITFNYLNLFLFIAAAAISVPVILFGLGSLLSWILLGSVALFAGAILMNVLLSSFYPSLKLDAYFIEIFALLAAIVCGLPLIALGIGPWVSWILIGVAASFVLVAMVRLALSFSSTKYTPLPEKSSDENSDQRQKEKETQKRKEIERALTQKAAASKGKSEKVIPAQPSPSSSVRIVQAAPPPSDKVEQNDRGDSPKADSVSKVEYKDDSLAHTRENEMRDNPSKVTLATSPEVATLSKSVANDPKPSEDQAGNKDEPAQPQAAGAGGDIKSKDSQDQLPPLRAGQPEPPAGQGKGKVAATRARFERKHDADNPSYVPRKVTTAPPKTAATRGMGASSNSVPVLLGGNAQPVRPQSANAGGSNARKEPPTQNNLQELAPSQITEPNPKRNVLDRPGVAAIAAMLGKGRSSGASQNPKADNPANPPGSGKLDLKALGFGQAASSPPSEASPAPAPQDGTIPPAPLLDAQDIPEAPPIDISAAPSLDPNAARSEVKKKKWATVLVGGEQDKADGEEKDKDGNNVHPPKSCPSARLVGVDLNAALQAWFAKKKENPAEQKNKEVTVVPPVKANEEKKESESEKKARGGQARAAATVAAAQGKPAAPLPVPPLSSPAPKPAPAGDEEKQRELEAKKARQMEVQRVREQQQAAASSSATVPRPNAVPPQAPPPSVPVLQASPSAPAAQGSSAQQIGDRLAAASRSQKRRGNLKNDVTEKEEKEKKPIQVTGIALAPLIGGQAAVLQQRRQNVGLGASILGAGGNDSLTFSDDGHGQPNQGDQAQDEDALYAAAEEDSFGNDEDVEHIEEDSVKPAHVINISPIPKSEGLRAAINRENQRNQKNLTQLSEPPLDASLDASAVWRA